MGQGAAAPNFIGGVDCVKNRSAAPAGAARRKRR
nr:MAG TPA: hypothetical protein [Caudoviricetes sp.]